MSGREAPVRDAAEELRGLRWLLDNLVSEVPGLRSVAVVSADGLPLLSSESAPAAVSATVPRQTDPDRGGAAQRHPRRGRSARSPSNPGESVTDLAAVVAGLGSITAGAAELMDAGRVRQTLVGMDGGSLLVMSISDGSLLGVHAEPDTDPGQLAYQMALFVGRAGHLLTPEIRTRLQAGA